MWGVIKISLQSKPRSVNFFSKYFCEASLCLVAVISIQYSSFEVTFWTVRTLEFRSKWCCIVVNVSLFCLVIFFQVDDIAPISCVHWKCKLFCKSYSCLRVFYLQKHHFCQQFALKSWYQLKRISCNKLFLFI